MPSQRTARNAHRKSIPLDIVRHNTDHARPVAVRL